MFPCVLSVKTTYADTARVVQATRLIPVEICVTVLKRSIVGVLRAPYISNELWWQTKAKLITPTAWNTPGPISENRMLESPCSSAGVRGASNRTEKTIISMPTRANPEARASLSMERCNESGYDTHIVHRAMMNWRFVRRDSTGIVFRVGNRERMTAGMVSPIMMPNAHIPASSNKYQKTSAQVRTVIPPNANANWKKDTAARPLGPKHASMISI
jgi:hypothetical protein